MTYIPDQFQRDREHLKILAILHYVMGGLSFVGVAGLVFHYYFVNAIMSSPEFQTTPSSGAEVELITEFMLVFYIIMGGVILLVAAGNVAAGYLLQKRAGKVLIFIVSGVNCLNVPLGTGLGVFTFVVLSRPSVHALFTAENGPPR